MTEEINHSYDGGLYAELIRNRIFMDDVKAPAHWSVVQDAGGAATISLDTTQPVSGTVLTTCLKLNAGQASAGHRIGIANDGYWGIPVKPGTVYRASFYAKTDETATGPLIISIESDDGATTFGTMQVPQVTNQWQKYTATLTTQNAAPSVAGRFVIATEKPGTFEFNLVSLFPPTFNDRPNGSRIDIMQKLIDLKPTFLRCPGGNYLEGDTIETRFQWKTSLHDLAQRPGHQGCWSYRSSDGLGLLEFMQWCEDIHAEPLLAVYAGYSLKGEHVNAGADLQPFVDETLDEIEYLTGDATTPWGAERVKDGHPNPFSRTYVEIGNEDQYDKSHSYSGRFTQIRDAIRAKYPKLQCIATTSVKDTMPDVMDDHFYRSPDAMESDTHHYDKTSRTGPKVFVGEWATRDGAWNRTSGIPTPDMKYTLSDAAWLTGLERNSDIVVMQCYAPLLVNVNPGALQWVPDLIGYDALTSYGSPSYYAQQMFSNNMGDVVPPLIAENIPTRDVQGPTPKAKEGQPAPVPPAPKQIPTLFFVATKSTATGTVYIKIVNTAGEPQQVQFNLSGAASIVPEGTAITLNSANPKDTNTITEPMKIVPVTKKISGLGASFTRTFVPYSVNVLKIETR
jgi:alpha-N-arabinofuranosidase